MQLAGFKSFADRTSIKFEEGVTCIVGPNGCGKSNVADAVRWVLGEQSAKALRGTNMQDVIFNGTQTRRALSFCEVTLVFDNSKHLFDIEYEEVAMTRRLYRSGESEYLLNKQPCRLKDIVALLHGVGIGKEGYSIIGQGKVEQIMNAKPEDRRAIFEEATGVMKFKAQKGEIERKLESAGDNLTFFTQRIDEAERQLKPLEKQAETAKKHREFSEQLKYEEVNAYLVRVDGFERETGKQRAAIAQVDARLQTIEGELAAADVNEAAARESVALSDEKLNALNEKLRNFEVGIEHRSGVSRLIGERLERAQQRLAAAEEEQKSGAARMAELARLRQENEGNLRSGERRAAEIEKQCLQLNQQLDEAEIRLQTYEKLSDETRASEMSSVEDLADIRANAGSLAAQKKATGERLDEAKEAAQKARARREEYALQLGECSGRRAACEQFLNGKAEREEELSETLSDLNRSYQQLNKELTDCRSAIVNLENNLELYTNLKNRFDGYRDSVRNLQLSAKKNAELGSRIKGAIADIVSTDKQYEVAIETAFGAAMQNLVTATADDARYLIEYLKRTGGGVVTFLPVSAIRPRGNSMEIKRAMHERGALGLADELVHYDPYYENIIGNLLGNTLVCDTIGNATAIAKKFPRSFRIVTLDGDIIATSGAMTGGSKRRDSGNLLAGERHIKECEAGIRNKQATAEKLQRAIAGCERARAEAQQECDDFRVRVQEEAASFAALSEKEQTLNALVEQAERDISDYEEMIGRLQARLNELESEVMSSSESEDMLSRRRTEAAKEAAARAEDAAALRAERDKLAGEVNALRVEGASVASALQAGRSDEARYAEENDTLAAREEQLKEELEQLRAQIGQLRAQAAEVALTEEEQREVAGIRSEIANVQENKKATALEQGRCAERKRALLAEQQTLSARRHACELEISRAEVNLENARQRIEEAYGLDYEGASTLRDEAFDPTQAAQNIASLKRKISALGPVNQNAEEDYALLYERYHEMFTQKEDLEKGISDLTTVLNDLKDAMQKQFDEGFNEINANFTKIFKELFGGGKAEMQLDYTDCDDPLNAGIEIVACPPGKKLTKISLLSGGERALTAIAILFAILRSRPMPFCILDEIEAALDEANVDRFASYLKKFSHETQFIVITHRRPTMNKADTLFGVTMEEKGVSKIVSVKLSEVEERLGGDTIVA